MNHSKSTRCVLGAFLPLVLMAVVPVRGANAPKPWPPDQFLPVTAERIAALPVAEQPAWRAYLAASEARTGKQPTRQAAASTSLQPLTTAPKGGVYSKGLKSDAPDAWYATDEARAVADHVITWQTHAGGWVKGSDYSRARASTDAAKSEVWSGGTFDNDSTTTELRFLARVIASTPDETRARPWREAFLRGLDYALAAQYPNGGIPQIYPLAGGYHDAVTFNDSAMVHVLELMRDLAAGRSDFAFVPAELRREAGQRMERGLRCILATQLKDAAGRKTTWCQQYDALTLKPCAARNFEPIADNAQESTSIVIFLMSLPKPSAEIVAAVNGAIDWFQRAAQHDLVWVREPAKSRGEAVPTPGAPLAWARFYDPGTLTPIFGDRDRTIHYVLAEISAERRAGYAWYGTWPAAALETYQTWRKEVGG